MSMLMRQAAGGSAPKTYVDDVFSTWLYDGNGSTQTITNGIDLAGKGGMVWTKGRSIALSNNLWDTQRGVGFRLVSDATSASLSEGVNGLTAFNSNGFNIGPGGAVNNTGSTYTSWTFRRAPKFFDVVTYTGDGTAGRQIAHSLGQAPGMIVVKKTNTSGDWWVYHRSTTADNRLLLNTTAASAASVAWANTEPTATHFTVRGNGFTDDTGDTYVAYLFAHDTASDGMIQCGSYVGNGSATGPTVTLGWEPQYLMIKRSGGTGNWQIIDNMRGNVVGGADALLQPNLSNAETSVQHVTPTATGFQLASTNADFNTSGSAYIYLAIRRPNKPPTSGTQVFNPTVYTGTNVDNRLVNTGILTDMAWFRQRDGSGAGYEGFVVGDRLRGQPWLKTGATQAERTVADGLDQQLVSSTEYGTAFSSMTGVWVGNESGPGPTHTNINANTTSLNHIALAFKRAPGFFDVVCYTGTGSTVTVNHSLGVVPELIISKTRSAAGNWWVWFQGIAANSNISLDNTGAVTNIGGSIITTGLSSTQIPFANGAANTTATRVTYLFASLPGISKVGSYTGNGSSQTINCSFTTGARFVLIKRTDSTGDWYVWDTARGIIAANDPHLSLNTAAAEVTTNDSIDPDSTGFIVNQVAATNVNVTSATYIYLAIA